MIFKCENRFNFEGDEIDILLKESNIAIEYDGKYWHSSERRRIKDEEKSNYPVSKGIRLIRIIEDDYDGINGDIIYCKYDSSYRYLNNVIRKIFFLIDNNIKQGVNIERDRSLILSKYLSVIKEKSIVNKAPELLQNWDSDLNGSLNLEYITYMSSQKLHWKSHVCGY